MSLEEPTPPDIYDNSSDYLSEQWFVDNKFKKLDESLYELNEEHSFQKDRNSGASVAVLDLKRKYPDSHENLKRMVAMKVSDSEKSDSENYKKVADMVLHEGQMTPEHPNVVRVDDIRYAVDSKTGKVDVVLIMEGLKAESNLENKTDLDIGELVDFVTQSASAFDQLAAQGVYSRDIKPGNCFIYKDASGNNVVKWIDFGISNQMVERYPNLERSVSDPYVSPERISKLQNPEIDYDEMKSEIYSMAASVF